MFACHYEKLQMLWYYTEGFGIYYFNAGEVNMQDMPRGHWVIPLFSPFEPLSPNAVEWNKVSV